MLQTYAMFESRFDFETIFPRIKFWKRSAMLQTHRLNKLLSDYIINVPCLYLWLVPSTKRVTRDSRAMELSRISPSSREQPRMARGTGVSSGDSWATLFPFSRSDRKPRNRNRAPDSVPLYDGTHLRAFCIASTWAVLPLSPCSNRLEDFCSLTGHH